MDQKRYDQRRTDQPVEEARRIAQLVAQRAQGGVLQAVGEFDADLVAVAGHATGDDGAGRQAMPAQGLLDGGQ